MARWLGRRRAGSVGGGASYLQVIDVGAWDNSLMLQLARPVERSALAALSRPICRPGSAAQMQPMLFSRAAVDAHVERRIALPRGGRS